MSSNSPTRAELEAFVDAMIRYSDSTTDEVRDAITDWLDEKDIPSPQIAAILSDLHSYQAWPKEQSHEA